jgi:peptide/nickel transport system permease protein
MAMLFAVIISIPCGIYAARHQNQGGDVIVMTFTQLGLATPEFWLGILLVLLFSVELNWFTAGGFPGWGADVWESFKALLLPACALGVIRAAVLTRLTRSSMLEVLREDYVRTARAKGVGPRRTVWTHVLKGTLLPVIAYLGPATAAIITGSILIETIFALPGIGRHFVDAALNRDYPMVMGITLLYGALLIVLNIVTDLIRAWIDPRLRDVR